MNVLVAAPLLLALTLIASGASKVGQRRSLEEAMVSLRVPFRPAHRTAAAILPGAEIVLALVLFSPWRVLAVASAVLALALMLTYLLIIARALTFEEAVECSCFGSFASPTVTRATLWRNILLSLLAVVAVIAAATGVTSLAVTTQAWLVLGWGAALAVGVVLTVLVLGGVDRPSAGIAVSPAASGAGDTADDEDLLDYERQAIPFGAIQTEDGQIRTLSELASSRAVLLLIVSQGCGSCVRVLEQLPVWREQLESVVAVHTVFTQSMDRLSDTVRQQAGPNIGHDVDRNLRRVFEVRGTPAAVLLGADGYLAGGPVSGGGDVIEFVGEIIEQLALAKATGELPGSSDRSG